MPDNSLRQILGRLAGRLAPGAAAKLTDGELLGRFLTVRDEAAFEALLGRHGPMVLGLCRRTLRDPQDAQDAFQATFLTLVRKGGSIGQRQSVGSWLFKVAQRTALRARARARRRPTPTHDLADVPGAGGPDQVLWRDVRRAVDEEVGRLPAAYRDVFVLCCLEGRTDAEAARELGCPRGTVHSRLAQARRLLRERLTARGVTLAGTALAALAALPGDAAALPRRLLLATVRLVTGSGAKGAAPVPAAVAILSRGASRWAFPTKALLLAAVVLAGVGLVGGLGLHLRRATPATTPGAGEKKEPVAEKKVADQGPAPAPARPPEPAPKPPRKEADGDKPADLGPKPVRLLARAEWGRPVDGDGPPTALGRLARSEKEAEQFTGPGNVGLLAQALKVPAIDFRKHTLAFVTYGPLTHGGTRVEVTRVAAAGKALTVYWKLHEPGPEQPVTGVHTHPGAAALLERFEGEVRFVREGK